MKIGFYGMPTAGKSYILERIDFIEVIAGSAMLRKICPDFDSKDESGKCEARQELAKLLASKGSFIMDGHYAFGDKIAFTQEDGQLYDVFIYLYISPEVIKERMRISERNIKYLNYDVEEWQNREIESIRSYCHANNKDFYVIDNPPKNTFDDVSEIVEFIRAIINGFSCVALARRITEDILKKSKSNNIILMDGDKTITIEDSSNKVFGYTTHLYDGNFYTGFQSWKQDKEFKTYQFQDLTQMPVSLNENVCSFINNDTYILTSGHRRIWSFIARELRAPFYSGEEMSAETKLYITKFLQNAGKTITAYGDGMNDYFMLKQANKGFLVTKRDSTISRSLVGRDLEGINLV